jgi:hypothetical protein
MKFHGGGGDFFNNGITTHLDDAWKITFDDWIPAYGFDSNGANTRWLGYVESLDIYDVNISTPAPDSGIVKGYTLTRVNWELKWILDKWNSGNGNTIDTNRFYLIGTSQGCAGVLLLSMTNPGRFAAGTMTVPKYDLTAPEDSNPDCKFNEGGSAVKQTRILFGDENFTNLQTDIPVNPGEPGVFRIYDLSNTNYTLNLRKNSSLPFLFAINGKNDDNTCWQEKIAFYNTVQATRTGGVWKWDLRQHNGIAGVSWSPFDLQGMKRFSLLCSYPAFSYTTFDGDPGSADVSSPPYYNGDDVGALHAAVDWIDSSIVDSSYFYQVKLFTYQSVLEDGSLIPDMLPLNAVTDVTIRRAQQFKNFAPGTSLCWMNFYQGKLIQSGVVNQTYDDSIPLPITVQRVRIFQDGSILRIMRCDSIQPTGMIPPEENLWNRFALQGPDDPIMSLFATESAEITLLDITGRELPGDVSNPVRSGSAMYSPPISGFFIVKVFMNGMPIHLKCVIT